MPLIANETDSFPGANQLAVAPFSSADCCLFATVELLSQELGRLGIPCTLRAGQLFFEETDAALLTMCSGPAPTVTSVFPDPMMDGQPNDVVGTSFGAIEGEVFITDAATFEGSVLKVLQTIGDWDLELIDIQVVRGGLPMPPTKVYVYAFNACGRGNLVGFETTMAGP